MKKSLLLSLFLISILSSCASVIEIKEEVPKYKISHISNKPLMDFIGFKIDSSILSVSSTNINNLKNYRAILISEFDLAKNLAKSERLKKIGSSLENDNIAYNKSDSYFGIYSLQEMEVYNTNSRYVTFIEVEKSSLRTKENLFAPLLFSSVGGTCLYIGGLLGGLGSGLKDSELTQIGIPFTVIGIPFAILGITSKTTTNLDYAGIFNIYIYDTVEKKLLRKNTVSIKESKKLKGDFYLQESQDVVNEYLSSLIYVELVKEYDKLNLWISSL